MSRPTAFFLAALIGVLVAVAVPVGWEVWRWMLTAPELTVRHLGIIAGAFVGAGMYVILRGEE